MYIPMYDYVYIHTRTRARAHTARVSSEDACPCVLARSGMRVSKKRPIVMAEEAYFYGKRDLLLWKKRPIVMAEEAY